MGLVDSAVAFAKGIGRILLRLVLLPYTIPKKLYGVATSARGASPATKAITFIAVLLAGVAGAGLFFATQANVEVSASSAPVVSAFLRWATNGWGYVIAAFIFGRGTIWGIRRTRIAKSAQETGYKPQTIERLADEIRTTDGSNRAIIFGADSFEKARKRILDTFSGGDDRIAFEGVDDVRADIDPDDQGFHPYVLERLLADHARTAEMFKPLVDERVEEFDDEPSRAERFKLWRMDLATGLRTDDVVWKLLVPTAIVFVLELILVQFWVQWWLYPSLLAGAFLVGLGVYQVDRWRRSRRLKRARQDTGGETWEEITVLVKTVETDEMTVYMGFLAGRSYASTDRQELAETLATRALERSHGYHPSPALEERYAWCLDRYIPNFAGWRENMEKPAVMDQLVNEVLDSEEGMLPKEVLAQRVIEHDRRYIWQGLRFVGMGHDPDLVAECYEDLVPNTLVEHDLTIRAPDGDREVTAVRARTETLPPDVAQLRATFSERFPIRKMPDRYSLPAVEPDELTRGFTLPSDD